MYRCNPVFYQEVKYVHLSQEPENAYLQSIASYTENSTEKIGEKYLRWMNRLEYWQIGSSLSKPFYFALKPGTSDLSFEISSLPKDTDYCLTMQYYLTSGSQMGYSAGSNTSLLWTTQPTSPTQPSHSQLCIRSLINANDIGEKLTNVQLKIASQYPLEKDVLKQFVAVHFESESKPEIKLENIKSKTNFVELNKPDDSLFPLIIPNSASPDKALWSVSNGLVQFNGKVNTFGFF